MLTIQFILWLTVNTFFSFTLTIHCYLCTLSNIVLANHRLCFAQDVGPITVAMDANFGLVRKHHSGSSPRSLSVANGFFLDKVDVDSFVDEYSEDKQKDNVTLCSYIKDQKAVWGTKTEITKLLREIWLNGENGNRRDTVANDAFMENH